MTFAGPGSSDYRISSDHKPRIRLTYAELSSNSNGQKGNRNEIADKNIVGIFDEFLPDGSPERRFMPLVWRTWRYLQLDVAQRINRFTLIIFVAGSQRSLEGRSPSFSFR